MMTDTSFNGIDHVQIAIPPASEAAARRFYVDHLGMNEIAKPESLRANGGLWLEVGTHQLHLGVMPDFHPATKAHPAIAVRNLQAFAQMLTDNGVTRREGDPLPGARRFFVTDPFGNRIEFLEWDR